MLQINSSWTQIVLNIILSAMVLLAVVGGLFKQVHFSLKTSRKPLHFR